MGEKFFYYESVVEGSCYELFKTNPLNKSINYLAVPWAILLVRSLFKIENILIDDFLPNIKLNGGFTICYHLTELFDKSKIFSKLKEMGIDCVFSPGASLFETEYFGVKIEPLPYVAINGVEPSDNKDILYSFIGKATDGNRMIESREKIFAMNHPSDTFVKSRQGFFPSLQDDKDFELMQNEYRDVLARSRFSLCPRGQQPNSIRFWESLQAGAIPILISDSARLPEWFDWSSCIIRINEKDVEKIPSILSEISEAQEEEMRRNCLKAYKLFSGENLISTIRVFYKTIDTQSLLSEYEINNSLS